MIWISRRAWLRVAIVAVGAGSVITTPSLGQRAALRISVYPGIDTTQTDVAQIVRLTRDYLTRPDTSAMSRGLWSTARPFDRRWGDMIAPFIYFGFPATILGVTSAAAGDTAYVVKILHSSTDEQGRDALPAAVQRIYAVRAADSPYGWQLSNAFSHTSGHWVRRTHERITFHYAPGQSPNPAQSARAALFVDSIAALFAVTPPDRIDCIVAASPDEFMTVIGLDMMTLPSGPGSATGGRTSTGQRIVYSGDPSQGEAYLHELAHAVLAPYLGGGAILSEGIPTWLGGSKGRPTSGLYDILAKYLDSHPHATLEGLVRGAIESNDMEELDALYATGALFVEHVYRRSSVAGLRALKGTPSETTELLTAMRRHLGLAADSGALESWWRQAARAAVSRE